MKFPTIYKEQFNIEREVVVLFSDYENFEPRTLDAFESAFENHQELRIEKICSFLISRDKFIENKIQSLLSNSTETQVIVPFNYKELKNIGDLYFFRNRIKEHFYNRDLFSYESALKKDIYFFGRTDLVHGLANRHRCGENSGIFGLRKTGKTSIIFSLQRVLKANREYSVYIDCQDPSFYLLRWNLALHYIIQEIKRQNSIECLVCNEQDYTIEKSSTSFEKDLKRLRKKINHKPILLIFDEVERITFDLSTAEHWKSGYDFIHFWRTLRSIFQKNESLITYLIVSTNPKAVETPTINGDENPIFSQIPLEYIPPFKVKQTNEMVSRLSQIMGLKFDDIVFSMLTEDYGGHPFLMRMVCSIINKTCTKQRPVRIDKTMYEDASRKFNQEYANYVEMVITVLKEYYNDEYEMLKLLSLNEYETFLEFANESPEYTNHLIGYNIVDKNAGKYFFRVEAIKEFLISKNKYRKIGLTQKEKLSEISERRNDLEPRIRNIIKSILHAVKGESEAKKIVLDILGEPRKSRYNGYSFRDTLSGNKSELYFEDLRKIISKEWDSFKNVFGSDKDAFNTYMKTINKFRIDAHAKNISHDEMVFFRVAITNIEECVHDFLA